jgi:hypothetical protein
MPSATGSYVGVSTNGAKVYTSDPFPVKIGNTTTNYTLKTDANVANNNIIASKLSLQDTVTGRSGKTDRVLAESTDGGNTWKYATGADGKPILSAEQQKALKPGGSLYTSSKQAAQASAKKEGATPEQQKQLDKGNNSALTDAKKDPTAAEKAEAETEAASLKNNTRTSYSDLKYPEKLQLEYQDCIKFSAIEYVAPGLTPKGVSRVIPQNLKANEKFGNRKILGTVTLPIPGGISDGNSVSWQDDSIDAFSKAFADIAKGTITEGAQGTVDATGRQIKGAVPGGNTSAAKSVFLSRFIEAATNTSNIQQRLTGNLGNPNLELLFTGPSLRSFTFTFRLSPRSKEESIEVRRIIRFFKQTMSVKRSQSTLLLRSPHTFAIAYLTSNKEHPYLNKFKECALQSCNVSYTPDGNYMSFNGEEPSMTSYELSLTFKELEAIFDDDYGNNENNPNKDFIGY